MTILHPFFVSKGYTNPVPIVLVVITLLCYYLLCAYFPPIGNPLPTTLSFPQHTGGEPQGEVLVRPWVKLDDAVPNILGRPLTGL